MPRPATKALRSPCMRRLQSVSQSRLCLATKSSCSEKRTEADSLATAEPRTITRGASPSGDVHPVSSLGEQPRERLRQRSDERDILITRQAVTNQHRQGRAVHGPLGGAAFV